MYVHAILALNARELYLGKCNNFFGKATKHHSTNIPRRKFLCGSMYIISSAEI